MKSNSKLVLLLTAFGAMVWAGCQMQAPTGYSHITSGGDVVANFDGANPLSVNLSLAEANRPNNTVITAGSVVIVGATGVVVSSALVSPGAAGTADCLHVFGTINDPGNATYPEIQMQVPLEKSASVSAYYDASFFTGIQFYIKTAGSDTAGKRIFSMPIAQTQPSSAGGDCNPSAALNACYNDFFITYNNTNGAWQLVTAPFSSFTRGNYGSAVTPTTLSGTNLQQILMLDWLESNNNVAGFINVDFSVDQIQFY